MSTEQILWRLDSVLQRLKLKIPGRTVELETVQHFIRAGGGLDEIDTAASVVLDELWKAPTPDVKPELEEAEVLLVTIRQWLAGLRPVGS